MINNTETFILLKIKLTPTSNAIDPIRDKIFARKIGLRPMLISKELN